MSLKLKRPDLLRAQGLIDGQWRDAASGESFPVSNPANNDVITTVPRFDKSETESAIAAADRALPAWRSPAR